MSMTSYHRIICAAVICMMMTCVYMNDPVYASDTVNKESLITNIKNPSNGVIKYNVTVPAGEKIDYSVELTPDKRNKTKDVVKGSWKNKTKKTVKKTVTVNVKYLTNKYKIKVSYTKEKKGEDIIYQDIDKATSSLKNTVYTSKLSWDFDSLGKGNKNWKYRYKYVPFKNGFKKYVQVYNKAGLRIKSYVKETVPVSKISKIIKEMKAR